MSNVLIPYSFTPGTKAKADEVNANFNSLASEIDNIKTTVTVSVNNINSSLTTGLDSKLDKYLSNSPISTNCIMEAPNGVATYSGTTLTVKSGLKVLISNGRNSDGTLNNIEYTLNTDKMLTLSNANDGNYGLEIDSNGNIGYNTFSSYNYIESYSDLPTPKTGKLYLYYVNDKNNWYISNDGASYTVYQNLILGKFTITSGVITSLTPYQTVDLLKKSDYMPCTKAPTTLSSASFTTPDVVIENYQNGTEFYRKWSSGLIVQGGAVTVASGTTFKTTTITFLKAFSTTTYSALCNTGGGSSGYQYYNGVWTDNRYTTTMTIYHVAGSGNITIQWIAYGY